MEGGGEMAQEVKKSSYLVVQRGHALLPYSILLKCGRHGEERNYINKLEGLGENRFESA
jgi:hypothetical protein